MQRRAFLAGVVITGFVGSAWGGDPAPPAAPAKKVSPVFAPITDALSLPRVLLIGDSISIGYTLDVRKQLDGVANVHRIPTNGGPTINGLAQIDRWLGTSRWDVIHFNWGLHDLKYINDKKQLVDVAEGHIQVPLADYEQNLRRLVRRLRETGAKLIWCSTTPVPVGAQGRIAGDELRYNEVAARVMRDEGVAIDDLHAFALPQLDKIQLRGNVHFTPAGSAVLAGQVAASIRQALGQ